MNFKIRIHVPSPAEYPFVYFPPYTPGGKHLPYTSLPASPIAESASSSDNILEGTGPPNNNNPPPPRGSNPPHTPPPGVDTYTRTPRPAPPPTTEIDILTINAKKAGYSSPSLTDMATTIDLHTPDILLLTKIPMHPHQGTLTHILRNRGYKTHYHLVNFSSPAGMLPEARLPPHTTHNGGGC